MPYGEESKKALVKLIGGKSTTIYVYDEDQFERYVGDIYCDNVFIQVKRNFPRKREAIQSDTCFFRF
jgi:endonuclease YncB( thermonuclease family)